MLSHEYETIIIVRPDVEDSAVKGIAEKFEGVLTEGGGHILDREDWGSRKLAYPIAKHLRGTYVKLSFLAPAEVIDELERRIRLEDGVVRFMTVRLADAVDVSTRVEEAAVQRAKRLEEEARRAAEAAAAAEREAELQREIEERNAAAGLGESRSTPAPASDNGAGEAAAAQPSAEQSN
ncbi:MAG: 30S ribosomal protein S6 [Myxococcales bacterium]|nr:30S ribosomal protein S6 [Myxococcales bacterium]